MADIKNAIIFIKNEKVPFTIVFNGASYFFKTKESRNTFVAGLESFLSLGLPCDLLH